MTSNPDNLRKQFSELTDDRLIELATIYVEGMDTGAVEILRQEIISRNLPNEVLRGMEVQLNPIDEKTFYQYCSLIQLQPCPHCNQTEKPLNGATIEKLQGVGLFAKQETITKIGCPDCLMMQLNSATSSAVPLGIFSFLMLSNKSSKNNATRNQIYNDAPNQVLIDFVWKYLGAIDANKDHAEGLKKLMLSPKL